MLVLTRKYDEGIMIGDNIRIVVVEIRGDKVRLGIEAPKEIPVNRQEIQDIINEEKKSPELKPPPEDQLGLDGEGI